MNVTRLRQLVVAAQDRDAVAEQLTAALGLGQPYEDPGVGEFGLHNFVFPVGDAFLEVVSPVREGTTAGRYMQRHGGDAGYMVIFQVSSIAEARAHLVEQQCRTVWSGDFATISGTHLHPVDVGGAIVSVDEPRPPASWLWAGPNWEANVKRDVVSGFAGAQIADDNPGEIAARWSRLLNVALDPAASTPTMRLADGCVISFVSSSDAEGRTGLVSVDVRASRPTDEGRRVRIAGTDFVFVAS